MEKKLKEMFCSRLIYQATSLNKTCPLWGLSNYIMLTIFFLLFFGFCGILQADLQKNGDFEADAEGATTSDWSHSGLSTLPCTHYVTAEQQYAGTKSVKMTTNSTSLKYIYQVSTVTANLTYTLSAYFIDNEPSLIGNVSIYWYASTDGSGTSLSNTASADTSDSAAWQLVSVSGSAPATAQSCKIRVNIDNTTTTTYSLFADSVTFVEGGGAPPPPPTSGNIKAVITEIDAGQSSTGVGDAVELYVLESTASIGGVELVASGGGTVTFPTVAVSSGDYIIVHFIAGTNSTAANTNGYGNRQWDFYFGSAVSLTSTDNNITLKNSDDTIVDFVSYADDSTTYSATEANYDAAVSSNQWTPAATSEAEYIAGSVSSVGFSTTKTLNRAVASGIPTDTNKKDDWLLSDSSLGTIGASGTTGGTGAISGNITEVAPGISGGDFVEIFVTAACTDVSGVKIYDGSSLMKTFPSGMGTIAKDKYIVLWASQKVDATHVDETAADENGNGYIDLYSDESSPGITNTDGNITLKNAGGTIVDFMSFADDSTSYTGSETAYDDAFTAGQWSPEATDDAGYIAGSIAWSGSTSKSMYRLSENGQPKDSNPGNKADWSESSTSPGYGDFGGTPVTTTKILEVFQSPFSPSDGYTDKEPYKQTKIAYYLGGTSGDYQITMRVFDVSGHPVRILLDHSDGGGASSTVNWDGKDDNGNAVRTGIYIVNIEALNKTTGAAKKSSKRVVVGRKM